MTRKTGSGARINMDHIGVYRTVAAIVIATALASVIASWEGLIIAAAWLELPEQLRWIFPVMIDLPIAGLALGALSLKSLGRPGTAALFTATAIVFTAISASANFLHVVELRGLDDYTDWAGALAKGIAPAVTLVMTEALGALIAKPKPQPRKKKSTSKRTPRTVTTAAAQPVLFGGGA